MSFYIWLACAFFAGSVTSITLLFIVAVWSSMYSPPVKPADALTDGP